MKCDLCGVKQATVHLTEIINDKVTELHICEECAKKKGAQMEQQFDFADLLAGLAEFGGLEAPEEREETIPQCSECGMTYEEFKKLGRFGCAHCYEVFKQHITPLLKRIHGSSQHLGKIPQKASKEAKVMEEIKDLKLKLEKAVEREDFEAAAKLRDKIKEVKNKAKKKGK